MYFAHKSTPQKVEASTVPDTKPSGKSTSDLQQLADNSKHISQLKSYQDIANQHTSSTQPGVIQRVISNETYDAPNYAEVDLKAPLSAGKDADASVHPPGWCLDHDATNNPNDHGSTKPHFHQRGHLIGKQFGATEGGAKNLVTMTDATNGLSMQLEEDGLKQEINKHKTHTFRYKVTPVYKSLNYFHTGKTDASLKGHNYLRTGKGKAPSSIKMETTDLDTGVKVQDTEIINGLMYPQHLY
ncbi:MAG TPA: DNA/RNA non-specific endonuclease [Fluviicola sp.]|nr:DNA/RNA non-specific endonuclease [Fluviicola sp.]